MDTLRQGGFVNYPPRGTVNNSDCCIIVNANVHTENVIARELDDRVIGRNREDKNGLIILNLDDRQGYLAYGETSVIEWENQAVSYTLNHHFKNNLAVDKRVVLNDSVLLVGDSKVNKILAIRRRGSIHSALPALAHMLRAFTAYRLNTLLPGTKRRNSIVPDQPLLA